MYQILNSPTDYMYYYPIRIKSSMPTIPMINNPNFSYIAFPYSANSYTVTFNQSITCDVLVVGGGGSGGCRYGGGGGAGALISTTYTFVAGTYIITVGAGGTAINGTFGVGNNGGDTSIGSASSSSTLFLAKGGGGGGYDGTLGKAGGSSGGGSASGGAIRGSSTPLTNNVPSNIYGNIGGTGSLAISGTESSYAGAGGGGAGSVGNNATSATPATGGNGGAGVVNAITGASVVYAAGGGGGSESTATAGTGGGSTINSIFIVAGGAGSKGTTAAESGINGTGSGGGGSGFLSATNGTSGAGGSGVVIIKFPNYVLNLPSALTCDILVIGGGGAGGCDVGGGGGAGALIYKQNALLEPGSYTFHVGDGGSAKLGTVSGVSISVDGDDGYSSRILFNSSTIYQAQGGGGGGNFNNSVATIGHHGGCGGGGSSNNAASSNSLGGYIANYPIPTVITVLSDPNITLPLLQNVTSSTTDFYYRFLHTGPNNTSITEKYTEYFINFPIPTTISILAVGGGGGGGASLGSGGGAGGLVYISNYLLNTGTYKIRVGAGGIGMQHALENITINGTSTIIYDASNNPVIVAVGGARGNGQQISYYGAVSRTGGSGAGGVRHQNTGGSGTQTTEASISLRSRVYGFGNAGGTGTSDSTFGAGGGGGAGGVGGNATTTTAGIGGSAKLINITGANEYFAAGGGGSYYTGSVLPTGFAKGGLGATGVYLGGDGNGSNAVANTGSGGGGIDTTSQTSMGGNGSAGTVIIRFSQTNLAWSQMNSIGFNGATGQKGSVATTFVGGGGGGVGGAATSKHGGLGAQINITGLNLWYGAGGGAGCIADNYCGYGGNGIGGSGHHTLTSGTSNIFALQHNGLDNTGSGGGGGGFNYLTTSSIYNFNTQVNIIEPTVIYKPYTYSQLLVQKQNKYLVLKDGYM